MPRGDIETFYEDGDWHNRTEGQGGLLSSYQDKELAVAHGRRLARDRQVEHIIRRLDGTIDDRHLYTDDARNARR
jgi:hypothetical protein